MKILAPSHSPWQRWPRSHSPRGPEPLKITSFLQALSIVGNDQSGPNAVKASQDVLVLLGLKPRDGGAREWRLGNQM